MSRRRLERAGLDHRVALTAGDAVRLPHAGRTFDAVFMSFTLELFAAEDIAAVLGECVRVLRPGGRIAVVSLSKEGGPYPMRRLYEWARRLAPTMLDCRPIYTAGRSDRTASTWRACASDSCMGYRSSSFSPGVRDSRATSPSPRRLRCRTVKGPSRASGRVRGSYSRPGSSTTSRMPHRRSGSCRDAMRSTPNGRSPSATAKERSSRPAWPAKRSCPPASC